MIKCKTCRWFDPLGEEVGANGLCRFNPPTVVAIPSRDSQSESRAHTAWPYVRSTDRCGQHEMAPATVKR